MSYTTIAIIFNPNSTGSSEALARELAAQIKERLPKQKVQLIGTKYAGHGEKLAYEIATKSKHALVISSSGDGGYNDVVNGAMKALHEGHRVTTGLLPAGNANDHYHNLHEEELIEQIISGKSTKIDVLKLVSSVNQKPITRYAHSYIGFGFTPFVGAELNKTKLNPLKEIWVVGWALLRAKPVRLKIGKKIRSYESVVLSNVDSMSKYLKISRPSSVTDGKFEVTIFRRRNKLKLISVLLKAAFKRVEEDQQVREFSLTTLRKTLVQTDGEIIKLDARANVTITIERQALTCIV